MLLSVRARAARRVARLPRRSRRLPRGARLRLLIGDADELDDLALPVDPERDHVRGPDDAPVTLVEYGDFECPYCGQAEPIVRELLAGDGDLRYVWRHLPLTDVHPHAQLAARGGRGGRRAGRASGTMHALLFDHQDALRPRELRRLRRAARPRRRPLPPRAARRRARAAASRATSRAPTSAASPARRRSSSTAAATTAPTTSTRSRRR